MSTRVGTLQAPRAGGSIVLAAFLASLVMLTIAVVAVSLDRVQGQRGETTFVGRHVVNTPTELSGGIAGGIEQTFVGGTAANTPTEINGGVVGGVATSQAGITAGSSSLAVAARPAVMAAIISARDAADADPAEVGGVTGGNTPSELSGGMFERFGRHQRI